MARPDKLPRWADVSGTVTEPADAKKDSGWIFKEKPAFNFFNWLHFKVYQWLKYFDEEKIGLEHDDTGVHKANVIDDAALASSATIDLDRAVTTDHIRDDAVTTDKIADDAVGTDQLADSAVTNAILADAAALSVKGNGTNTAAAPTDLAAANDHEVLRRQGSAVGFGTINTNGIADDAVTASKLRDDPTVDGNRAVTTDHIRDDAVTTDKIADSAVTNALLADAAALSVKGNGTNTAAAPTDLVAANDGDVLRRSGTTVGFGSIAAVAVPDDSITNAKLAEMAALTIKGNGTNAAANPTDLAAANDFEVLRRSGTAVGFGTIAEGGIANEAVTAGKIKKGTNLESDGGSPAALKVSDGPTFSGGVKTGSAAADVALKWKLYTGLTVPGTVPATVTLSTGLSNIVLAVASVGIPSPTPTSWWSENYDRTAANRDFYVQDWSTAGVIQIVFNGADTTARPYRVLVFYL